MSRPTKDEVFLNATLVIGSLSTCDRGAVGAIITRDGRAVSWGYNGAPPGLPHCDENHHGWGEQYPKGTDASIEWEEGELEGWRDYMASEHGCRNVTHAEANALAFAARQGISTEGGTLYVGLAPCLDCARLLIAAGIVRVVVAEEYRDPAGVELLRQAGVTTDVPLAAGSSS